MNNLNYSIKYIFHKTFRFYSSDLNVNFIKTVLGTRKYQLLF